MGAKRKAKKKKPVHHHVHDFFIAHRRNGYEPGVFALGSVTLLLAGLLGMVSLYVGYTTMAQKSGFFAAVVPAALTVLTNQDRAANNLSALIEDPLLAQAAQLKAEDMAAKGYFAHNSPDGKTPWYWLDQVGYKYTYAGENLAIDFTDTHAVEQAWMASPTHKANIVKPQYTHIGIGMATGVYQGRTTTFVVQVFASPAKAAAKPTPVAAQTPTPKPQPVRDTQVLGAVDDTQPAAEPVPVVPAVPGKITVYEMAAASPSHTLAYILIGSLTLLLAIFAVMLGIHAHLRKIAIEAIGGGVLLTGAVAACLLYVTTDPDVLLPDEQAASVSASF